MQKNSQRNFQNSQKKYRWTDPTTGYRLAAGGILFHDNEGVWLIRENKKGKVSYTDPGGKYEPADGDIYATISREFCQEMYYSCEITRRNVMSFPVTCIEYVPDHENKPAYMCMVVHVKHLLKLGEDLDPMQFDRDRSVVLLNNDKIPLDEYPSEALVYIPFARLFDPNCPHTLSMRMKYLVKHLPRDRMEIGIENLYTHMKKLSME